LDVVLKSALVSMGWSRSWTFWMYIVAASKAIEEYTPHWMESG